MAWLLAGLRRDGRQQSGLIRALVPPDADTAYQVATRVARNLGWRVAGWKIAATKAEMQQALRTASPIYGRVYEQFVHPSPASLSFRSLAHAVSECEYMVRIGKDLPPRPTPYDQDEVRDAVVSISPGMEIAECRFVQDAAFPPLPAILADGSGSGSLIIGSPIPDWQDRDISNQAVVLRVDGKERRRGTALAALEHPLAPLVWLVNELSRTGIGIHAGEVVSTGTCTGMLRARPGEEHVADYGAFGEIRVRFIA